MKIDFITYNLRLCGLVRELVEVANHLSSLGNDITVWTVRGDRCTWLPQMFKTKSYLKKTTKTDALVLMDAPREEHMRFFIKSKAAFKTMVITGLNPDTFGIKEDCNIYNNKEWVKNLVFILKNYEMCADSDWQINHMKALGIQTGVAIGGVNTNMFYNKNKKRENQILISGDQRWSKGYDVVSQLLKNTEHKSYQGIMDQNILCDTYNNSCIYIDNHTWAGWCNPVIEAMACGCAVICSDIGAVNSFAIDNETALLVKPNDLDGFIDKLNTLTKDVSLQKRLSVNGTEMAKTWGYKIVCQRFQNYLIGKM